MRQKPPRALLGMPVLFARAAPARAPHQGALHAAVAGRQDRQHDLCDPGLPLYRPGDARAAFRRRPPVQGNHPHPAIGRGAASAAARRSTPHIRYAQRSIAFAHVLCGNPPQERPVSLRRPFAGEIMPGTGPSPRLRRMQWIAIALVTAAIALNYMDRSTLAIGNVKIRAEFGLNATAIGALGSAWALTYGIAQLPSGYLLDRIGPKFLVGAAMILWSLCQAAGGLAATYYQLMLSRIGLGATEAPCFPSATRSVSDWFDVKDRGTPSGVYTPGAYIGPTIAPPILTTVMLAFDWRVMFVVMGLAGVVAAGFWFSIFRDPRAQPLSPQDEEYLRANREASSSVTLHQWASLFRFKAMWALMLGAFCTGYITWMYQTWLPAYLETQQHISIAKARFLSSVPLICAFLGAL